MKNVMFEANTTVYIFSLHDLFAHMKERHDLRVESILHWSLPNIFNHPEYF